MLMRKETLMALFLTAVICGSAESDYHGTVVAQTYDDNRVSHYETLVAEEGMNWGIETAIRGATERLLPILMTALVVALGLLPWAAERRERKLRDRGPVLK